MKEGALPLEERRKGDEIKKDIIKNQLAQKRQEIEEQLVIMLKTDVIKAREYVSFIF